ncbi:hypothetical protein [Elizabethkingia ursingii]|nr:hypothetical protein [Elizabethkingia anophelis]MDV4088329.1 hypothetical protein [Elizabethkingia anophelis]
MERINKFIKWTNDNSGFLSVVLFFAAIIYGWVSGLFNSLIKKPKLKIRFIDKVSFYSFYMTGEKYEVNNYTHDLHKTGFVVYMSIANVGNMPTSIDKIYLGYYKNKKYKFWNERIWLAQWHAIEPFKINLKNKSQIIVSTLRLKDSENDNSDKSLINIGNSIIGISYFEQETAWGNYNPIPNKDKSTNIKIRIKDIYGNNFYFKYKLKYMDLNKAREYNPNFGNIESIL